MHNLKKRGPLKAKHKLHNNNMQTALSQGTSTAPMWLPEYIYNNNNLDTNECRPRFNINNNIKELPNSVCDAKYRLQDVLGEAVFLLGHSERQNSEIC